MMKYPFIILSTVLLSLVGCDGDEVVTKNMRLGFDIPSTEEFNCWIHHNGKYSMKFCDIKLYCLDGFKLATTGSGISVCIKGFNETPITPKQIPEEYKTEYKERL